jgi:hypothetical protein
MGEAKTIFRPHSDRPPQKAHRRLLSLPPAVARGRSLPLLRVHFLSARWQSERSHRLARICRSLDRGRASGKRLHKMLVWFAWRWKEHYYKSEPTRKMQFGYVTLRRVYYQWRANGGNPEALVLRYRVPVKLHKSHVLDFARVCINSGARSLAQAYGRLPRPRATVYAYRLALGGRLLRSVVKLFAARRLVDVRTRKARAAANKIAREGAK